MPKNYSTYFSTEPFSPEERQAVRAFLAAGGLELVKSYQAGAAVWRVFLRVVLWIGGATGGLLVIIQILKLVGWWPSNGGPAP